MPKNGKLTRKITQDNFVTEKIDVIKNNLLGTYDDDGNYTIASQIVEELVKLDKVKKTSFGNSVFCVGNLLGYGELVFELLFDSKTHNGKSASATLFLLEDVEKINGYLQNTIKTKLEDFNEEVDNFIEATYSKFNISLDEDDDSDDEGRERKLIDDLENEDSFILAKKQYSLLLDKLLDEKFLDAYGKYFTARISALTKLDSAFARTILDNFNKQHSLIENVFLQEKNYKTLNELLDKCIEEVSGTKPEFEQQEQAYNKEISASLETFVDSVNKLNDRYESKALNMLEKSDREKVEELLDEKNAHEEEQVYESKSSVEQIVNAVKSPKTKESEQPQQKKEESQQTSQNSTQEQKMSKESEYIKDMLDKKKEPEQTQQPRESVAQESFYSVFKDNHQTSQPQTSSKVVDTSRSQAIDTPEAEGEIAVTSLKDRIKRLEKFKEASVMEDNYQGTTRSDSVYSVLARERERKDKQMDIMNAKTREQLAREQQMREMQMDEMER
ncbi:MAG: hypothetical protein IJW59_04040 [Clostridia bacterium]|nr:hypothetical protein [Clostridia bacterium]